jgi:Protein of unknown function (DUF1501)
MLTESELKQTKFQSKRGISTMLTNVHRDNLHGNYSRRQMLQSVASGFGFVAFSALSNSATRGADSPLRSPTPHFPARAKRVIFLCMNGGPSHVDLFDYKPTLNARTGQATEIGKDRGGTTLLGSPFQFQQHGDSGLWFSELFPNLAKHADKLCMIHSMNTDLPNHSQAFLQMHTGSFQFTRPSLGAWTVYGMGTENANLPGFITLNPPSDNGGARNYGSGFLPTICQGTKLGRQQIPAFYAALLKKEFDSSPPFKNIENTRISHDEQRRQLDFIKRLNTHKLEHDIQQPEIEGAIESFELAFRMQDEVPKLMDLSGESADTQSLYGIGSGLPTDAFGRQCLLARRMAEAGVRFIEITAPTTWDHHFLIQEVLPKSCLATDQPIAALLTDLKQRGLLDDTLVMWAGEFGRTPYGQSVTGRDHNNKGYTIWMAGGGVRPGITYGATDEFGYEAVENPVHLHDWHATILHLLGFDHERLTYHYGGRDFRLTDVFGNVVKDILA